MIRATATCVLEGRASWALALGDAVAVTRTLPDACVHCCVTSPPYFGLRAYLDDDHPDKALEIGSEETPEEYARRMVDVFREVRRVLHPSGTLWLNLGDSFAGGGGFAPDAPSNVARREKGNHQDGAFGFRVRGQDRQPVGKAHGRKPPTGLKNKDLIGIPWLVAFALRADGWYLRQWMPWVKRNPMPESTEDRPGTACETVFLLSREPNYFFDMEAVKRAAARPGDTQTFGGQKALNAEIPESDPRFRNGKEQWGRTVTTGDESRNLRSSDLWFDSVGMLLADDDSGSVLGFDVPTKPYKGAHFAVMPKKLIEPCVLAGTSARGVCPACGEPWVRVVEKDRKATRPGRDTKVNATPGNKQDAVGNRTYTGFNARWKDSQEVGNRDPERHCTTTKTLGWKAGCACEAGEPVPAVVFDPFAGSGTVLAVAVDHGRRAIGIDLDADNAALVAARMRATNPPLFADVEDVT